MIQLVVGIIIGSYITSYLAASEIKKYKKKNPIVPEQDKVGKLTKKYTDI